MGTNSLHSTPATHAVLLGLAMLCAAGGCWQEIEYTGPDPSTVTRRRPRPPAETGSPAAAPEAASDTDRYAQRQQLPPVEPELPGTTESLPSTVDPPAGDVEEKIEVAEDPASNERLLDDLEPDQSPIADIETTTAPETAEPPPVAPAPNTHLVAWQLGSKLTLAALAHDRGLVPDDAAKWFAEARAAAEVLGTSVAELPEPATASESPGGSRRVHDYLFQQGQRVWHELSNRHGGDHAALFEVAVKSNVLLVLYQPGSSDVDALASSIREAAAKAELPADLWQPLLDSLADESPPAAVRIAVRRMHADVEHYLAEPAEQE